MTQVQKILAIVEATGSFSLRPGDGFRVAAVLKLVRSGKLEQFEVDGKFVYRATVA